MIHAPPLSKIRPTTISINRPQVLDTDRLAASYAYTYKNAIVDTKNQITRVFYAPLWSYGDEPPATHPDGTLNTADTAYQMCLATTHYYLTSRKEYEFLFKNREELETVKRKLINEMPPEGSDKNWMQKFEPGGKHYKALRSNRLGLQERLKLEKKEQIFLHCKAHELLKKAISEGKVIFFKDIDPRKQIIDFAFHGEKGKKYAYSTVDKISARRIAQEMKRNHWPSGCVIKVKACWSGNATAPESFEQEAIKKSALPTVNGKKPFIEYLKEELQNVGIEAVLVGYSGKILDYNFPDSKEAHEHTYCKLVIENENGDQEEIVKRASEVRYFTFTNGIDSALDSLPSEWRRRVEQKLFLQASERTTQTQALSQENLVLITNANENPIHQHSPIDLIARRKARRQHQFSQSTSLQEAVLTTSANENQLVADGINQTNSSQYSEIDLIARRKARRRIR